MAHTTITRLLERIHQSSRPIHDFRAHRADILARVSAKSLALQEDLLDDLERDRLAGALSPQQKSALLQSLNIVHGTLFDKERLERGQSSHNISVLSKLIDTTIQSAYDPVTQPVGDSASLPDQKNTSD